MKFSKKATCTAFLLILLLNIILRYPVVPHEIGWDSFVVHSVANSLSEFGFAKWWLHPLSVIGSYPYSISSAVPFLLSGISQLSGLNVDLSILLYSTIIGLLCIFILYILAGSFSDNSLFKFLVVFGFSTSSAILTFSSWTASTRTLFTVVLLPLILFLILKTLKTEQSLKYYALLACLLALGLATHHYVYFIIPLILSAVFVKIIYKYKNLISIRDAYKNILYCFLFSIAILYPFITRAFMEIERGYTGTRYGFLLMLSQSYFRYSGLLLLFAAVGFIYLVSKNQKNYKEWFVLISFVSLSPLLYMETYFKWFMPTYIFIFSGISLANIFNNKKNMVIILMLASILLSGYFQFIHFSDVQNRHLDDKSYTSGVWISNRINGNLVGTSVYPTLRIFSISETPTLTISDMLNYMCGFISYDEKKVVQKYSMFSVNYYKDSPYELKDASSGEWYVNALSKWSFKDKHFNDLTTRFNISYFILNEERDFNVFANSLSASNRCNSIYSNGKISIWNW